MTLAGESRFTAMSSNVSRHCPEWDAEGLGTARLTGESGPLRVAVNSDGKLEVVRPTGFCWHQAAVTLSCRGIRDMK